LGTSISGSSLPDGVISGSGVGLPVTFSMIGVAVAAARSGLSSEPPQAASSAATANRQAIR
jgi:hypothetical protein